MSEVWPQRDELVRAARRASEASQRLGLIFGQHHGLAGRWLGPGIGSSIEFEDHRPFTAGDDPRYLDWSAYARSGQLISKVYREEVSPQVDVAIDVTGSMFLGEDKRRRALELVYFIVDAARRGHASSRIFSVAGGAVDRITGDAFSDHRWLAPAEDRAAVPDLRRPSWRGRSFRILVSDLLFAADPTTVVRPLAAGAGRAVIFAPFSDEERHPRFSGPSRLQDVESGSSRIQHVDAATLRRYGEAYQRHFALWEDTCRRARVVLVRVGSTAALESALRADPQSPQAVVPWT